MFGCSSKCTTTVNSKLRAGCGEQTFQPELGYTRETNAQISHRPRHEIYSMLWHRVFLKFFFQFFYSEDFRFLHVPDFEQVIVSGNKIVCLTVSCKIQQKIIFTVPA